MGFFQTEIEYVTDVFRIKVPSSVYEIMMHDVNDFEQVPTEEQPGAFLNRMLSNFYPKAQSTIYGNAETIQKKYLALGLPDSLVEELTKKELSERLSRIYPYPTRGNGHLIRMRPNLRLRQLMIDSLEDQAYKTYSQYLSSLIQEYVTLPREQRELIYFDDTYRMIRNCIQECCMIELTMYDHKEYLFRPFSVTTNGITPWHYVIGYGHLKNNNNGERLYSFRLQRIETAKQIVPACAPYLPTKFKFTESEKKALNEVLDKPSRVPYLGYDPETITVRFTLNGLNLYRYVIRTNQPELDRVKTRKDYTNSADNDEMYTLHFHCTQEQAYQFFIKFGKDVEIIEPLSLRQRFAELHRKAAQYYLDMPIEQENTPSE